MDLEFERMSSARLLELQREFNSKQDELVRLVSECKEDGSPAISHAEAQELEAELDQLHGKIKAEEDLDRIAETHGRQVQDRRQMVKSHTHAGGGGQSSGAPTGGSHASLGPQVAEALKSQPLAARKQFEGEFPLDVNAWLGIESKATMTLTAWVPDVQYQPRVVDKIAAAVQVLDLFPTLPVVAPVQSYQEETTSVNVAVEIAENALFPEASIAMTARTATIKKIGAHLPLTDEVAADVPQLAQFLDTRMRYFVRKRLDLQLIRGGGTGVDILGLINTPSVLTQPKGGDDTMDAVYKAMNQIVVTGEAAPSAVLMHPNDFMDIRLAKTSLGYIWGPPSVTGPTSMWGIPLVPTTACVEGTAIVGDFSMSTVYLRQDALVETGWINDDFKFGRRAVRASLRAVLVVFRPQAFALVTGI